MRRTHRNLQIRTREDGTFEEIEVLEPVDPELQAAIAAIDEERLAAIAYLDASRLEKLRALGIGVDEPVNV